MMSNLFISTKSTRYIYGVKPSHFYQQSTHIYGVNSFHFYQKRTLYIDLSISALSGTVKVDKIKASNYKSDNSIMSYRFCIILIIEGSTY
jgi:hypothetical protein